MASAQKGFDQGRATVFTEGYCSHADMAYRFCYVLLLNPLSAKQTVQAAFREIASEVSGLIPNADSLAVVLTRCFKNSEKLKSVATEASSHPLAALLISMSPEERAVLFLMDVAGRTVSEAAGIIGSQEDKVRKSVASARKKLMQHPFSKIDLPETSTEESDSEL